MLMKSQTPLTPLPTSLGNISTMKNQEFSSMFHPRLKRYICNTLKMKAISRSDIYLGSPLFLGKKVVIFQHLIQRVKAKISGWKSKLLSQLGRATLIKSITYAIPMYQMSCFMIPKHVTKTINSLQRDFWWVKKDNSKKNHYLRSQKDNCMSTKHDKLGIRDMNFANLVAVSYLNWRILTSSSYLDILILRGK